MNRTTVWGSHAFLATEALLWFVTLVGLRPLPFVSRLSKRMQTATHPPSGVLPQLQSSAVSTCTQVALVPWFVSGDISSFDYLYSPSERQKGCAVCARDRRDAKPEGNRLCLDYALSYAHDRNLLGFLNPVCMDDLRRNGFWLARIPYRALKLAQTQ